MATKAQIKANQRYATKAYDKMDIRMPKGEKDIIKQAAAKAGMSLAEYVREACFEKAERMKK